MKLRHLFKAANLKDDISITINGITYKSIKDIELSLLESKISSISVNTAAEIKKDIFGVKKAVTDEQATLILTAVAGNSAVISADTIKGLNFVLSLVPERKREIFVAHYSSKKMVYAETARQFRLSLTRTRQILEEVVSFLNNPILHGYFACGYEVWQKECISVINSDPFPYKVLFPKLWLRRIQGSYKTFDNIIALISKPEWHLLVRGLQSMQAYRFEDQIRLLQKIRNGERLIDEYVTQYSRINR